MNRGERALEGLRAALSPDIHPLFRRAHLINARRDLGLDSMRWSHWAPAWLSRFSMYGIGAIIISKRVLDAARNVDWGDGITETAEIDMLAALIHELVHAARAEAFGPLLWRFLYLAWPPFRQAEELEADAYGIALRAQMSRVSVNSAYIHEIAEANAWQWTGWRWPYFCGGKATALTGALVRRVRALVSVG